MRRALVVKLKEPSAREGTAVETAQTYRQCALSEDYYIHVEGLKICRAVWVLVERPETDKVVVSEELDLFARLLHLDIFDGQRVNTESLPTGYP